MNNYYKTAFIQICLMLLAGNILISCAGTRAVKSLNTENPMEINANLGDWPMQSVSKSFTEEFDVAVANDNQFVYLAITFKNNRTQTMARDFGFRIYLDQKDGLKRSFGLVYPVGIVESIAEYPGARKSYLENPGWRNQPENRGLIESMEKSMPDRIQIISRSNRNDPLRPISVGMPQLNANGIEVDMQYESRRMLIELKIPIRSTRSWDFSVDDEGKKAFNLGFEIIAPDYEEITGERPTYENVESSQGGYDQYGGGRNQTRSELQVSNPQLYGLLNYSYQNWIQVRLDY